MIILRQEIKLNFRSWLYFTVSLLAVLLIFAAFFNVFQEDAAILDKVLSNFPAEFKAAFGFSDLNLSDINGYLCFLMSYVVLIGAVFGMKLGVQVPTEEFRAKTSDFLLTRPIRRGRVMAEKFAAILLLLIVQNILLYALGLAGLQAMIHDPIDIGIFTLLVLSSLLVQLFFVGIGLTLAAAINRIKSVMAITLGVVFFFFIIELLNESLLEKGLTYITPFAYYKGSSILAQNGFDASYVIINLCVFIIFSAVGFIIYQKRDVHAL